MLKGLEKNMIQIIGKVEYKLKKRKSGKENCNV